MNLFLLQQIHKMLLCMCVSVSVTLSLCGGGVDVDVDVLGGQSTMDSMLCWAGSPGLS